MIKAIILATDLSENFLPLSKVIPPELWPLGFRPIFYYLLQEIKAAGINNVFFVLNNRKKLIPSYFKKDLAMEKILKKKKAERFLADLKGLEEFLKDFSLFFISPKKLQGNGDALLQIKAKIAKEPFAVLSCDDIMDSKISPISQLLKIFKTCQRPIIGLNQVGQEKVSNYSVAATEKIANRLFKIKAIVEHPLPGQAPSNLAILNKCILIPEIFDYLKNQKPNEFGEIELISALKNVLKDGKIIYGYELEGKWLECRDKESYLKSNFYLLSKNH